MRRRTLLVAAGGLSLSLSGCLDANGQSGDASDDTGESTGSDAPRSDGGTTATTLQDESCPPYQTDADRTVCSHGTVPESASVFLEASPDGTTLDGDQPSEEITLTLHNRSASAIEFNPNSWYVWREADDGWQQLEREWSGDGVATVDSGSEHTWSLVEAVSSIQPDPAFETGRYAAEIRVPDPEDDTSVACVALIEFRAP